MQLPEKADENLVGQYQLVERLAVGGMAEVYLACPRGENALGRLVVIKRILPQLAEGAEFLAAFAREARIAARINHPNVVKIFELGSSSGVPFIAMEYVPGSTLKQLIRAAKAERVRLPIDVALDLVMQSCAGAHAAHELADGTGKLYGLVHRDISPHNLMVDDQGHVKLLDFGIAKAGDGMDQTRTGMLKGKISYMSPEQCRQERLDRRSDVFSLGIVAYELLTGAKPFGGTSELATMQAIVLGQFTPLMERRPDVPKTVAEVIEACFRLDRSDRWGSADRLRRELRRAALEAGYTFDPDRVSLLVRTLLGERHDSRQRAIETAMERTLVSFTGVKPLSTETLGGGPEDTSGTQNSAPQTTTDDGRARRAVAAGGVMASFGALVGVGGALVALIAIATAVWVSLSRTGPNPDPEPPQAVVSGAPIHVAVAPTMDPAELRENHEPIRRYLERTLARPFRFDVSASYEAASRAVIDGDVPYAMLPSRTTRLAFSEDNSLQVLAVKVVDGSASTDGYLLVRRDETRSRLEDMVGSTICYSDLLSNTGYTLPRQYIETAGLDPDLNFRSHVSGNHQQVLVDLLDGTCDLGGTYSGNFNTADQRNIATARLQIFAITGRTPHDAWVAGRASDTNEAKKIRTALLAFDPALHVGASVVGESERITGFEPASSAYLDP